jgi:MinD superfamily P-loop ATPase
MCSCCGCCCGVLQTQKKFNQPGKLFVSNYYAEVDSDLCIGCGTCEERCNLEAITLDADIAVVDLDRCIGCGVCVPTCTEEAMSLVKKGKETEPPRNAAHKSKLITDGKAEKARLQKT